jgi:hypothetical protein
MEQPQNAPISKIEGEASSNGASEAVVDGPESNSLNSNFTRSEIEALKERAIKNDDEESDEENQSSESNDKNGNHAEKLPQEIEEGNIEYKVRICLQMLHIIA